MNNKSIAEIAKLYVTFLEQADLNQLLLLFAENAVIHSPIYGEKQAVEFYTQLLQDTERSSIQLKGIFEEYGTLRLALYFEYTWTLKDKNVVIFDVIDIITFNEKKYITDLKIIYDTHQTRKAVSALLS